MRTRLLPLMLLCLLLSGCTADPLAPMADSGAAQVPAPMVEDLPAAQDQAVLWFRYGDEPLLAAETRILSVAPTESLAEPLLRALLEGPSAASTELASLFPQGTQLVSVTQSGQVMFVTLSHHLLSGYADEPEDWRSQPAWAIEVPLRRKLAMQSITATLTENCGVDTVIILVAEKTASTDSLRLRQSFFTLDTADEFVAEPLHREEEWLLTPARTAEVILQCWQESDWARLYRYLALNDPDGTDRPALDAFIAQMENAPHLLYASPKGGSVTANRAVFTVDGAWLDGGAEAPFTGRILRLTKEKGLWRVGLSQLTGREAMP